MSIIIKGVDLPNCSNEDCIVVIRKDRAEVWQTGFKERTVKAIQIPNPHGDLIDRNQVFTYSHRDVKNLEEVPVILEEEGE